LEFCLFVGWSVFFYLFSCFGIFFIFSVGIFVCFVVYFFFLPVFFFLTTFVYIFLFELGKRRNRKLLKAFDSLKVGAVTSRASLFGNPGEIQFAWLTRPIHPLHWRNLH